MFVNRSKMNKRPMLSIISYPISVLLISVLIQAPSNLNSQEIQHPPYGTDMTLQERGGGLLGSPLIFKEFESAILIDNKGQEFKNVQLNYDALNHVMLSKDSKDVIMQLNRYFYVTAVIDGQEFRNMSPFGMPGFARVLYDGEKIKCFERVESDVRPTKQKAMSQETATSKIVNSYKYLLWYNDQIKEIRRRDKDFYDLFSKNEVKSFLKANSLKLKNDADFASFLAHFESTL